MSKTTEIKILNLDEIRIDGGTQPRIAIDEKTVADYAELLAAGTEFPPAVAFFDGATYWLADGFHRYFANKRIKCDYLQAEIHKGIQRDAVLYSVGANAAHGMPRSNHDKRKAVLTLLEDKEWSQWSDSEIAKRCGVSHDMANRLRKSILSEKDSMKSGETSSRSFIHHKTGKPTKMKTTRIGSTKRRRGVGKPAFQPVRKAIPALAQTNINLPHDPDYGARAIVSAMGSEYAHALVNSLTKFLNQQKEGQI